MSWPQAQNLKAFRLPHRFRGRSAWIVQLWWLVQSTLFSLSPQFMYAWRRWLLRLFGARVGRGVLVRASARVTYPWKVSIGDRAWIGDNAVLYSLGEIEIGDNAVISQRSYLCAATHDYTSPSFDIVSAKITIGPEVWVAADVFVAPGVVIGQGAVVGARSSVFSPLPPMMLCYGNPAKPVRPRIDNRGPEGAGAQAE